MSANSSVSRRQRVLSIIALAIIVAPMMLGAALKLSHAQPASQLMRLHPAPISSTQAPYSMPQR